MKQMRERLFKFFFPGPNSPRLVLIMPYAALAVLALLLVSGSVYGWEYSNSPTFCGNACHTMYPEDTVYKQSPHANVTCDECHIGRASFFNQLARKSIGLQELYYQVFNLYTYPLRATALRPARETCEKCHQPETFSDDSLKVLKHFENDMNNTQQSIYLVLKTGGGAKRAGQGRGIHWHIVNKVEYYATDAFDQNIPYIRVYNDDGTTTEYTDVGSGFDVSKMDQSKLKTMDCITCHNRVTHTFDLPEQSVDTAMSRGAIDPSIPSIHQKAVDVLYVQYDSREAAFAAFDKLGEYYQTTDYYSGHSDQIASMVQALKDIYNTTVFNDQQVDWASYPNNLGHMKFPGCFRCHDGKHLNPDNQAIRLECNLCHSVPVVAGMDDFVATIEISRGPEPESHLNPNWISLHNQAVGSSCRTCHTMADPGGTSNTSFCSNSACHGNVFSYAGFNAPALRQILKDQLPPPEPAKNVSPVDNPTYDNYAGPLFSSKCSSCHGDAASGGLNLLGYETAMKGGKDGAVIVPYDAANSLLVKIQSAGGHFANLTSEELSIIKKWIDNGAPEK